MMLKCAIFGKSKEIREEDRWCSERSREGTEVFMYKPFSSFHTTCNACMHGKRFFLIFLSFTTRKMKTKNSLLVPKSLHQTNGYKLYTVATNYQILPTFVYGYSFIRIYYFGDWLLITAFKLNLYRELS